MRKIRLRKHQRALYLFVARCFESFAAKARTAEKRLTPKRPRRAQ